MACGVLPRTRRRAYGFDWSVSANSGQVLCELPLHCKHLLSEVEDLVDDLVGVLLTGHAGSGHAKCALRTLRPRLNRIEDSLLGFS